MRLLSARIMHGIIMLHDSGETKSNLENFLDSNELIFRTISEQIYQNGGISPRLLLKLRCHIRHFLRTQVKVKAQQTIFLTVHIPIQMITCLFLTLI